MLKPKGLSEQAGKFWDRHAKRLKEQGLLTADTLDAFTILAETWADLRDMKHPDDPEYKGKGWMIRAGLRKAFNQYARGFGMSSDKPRSAEPQDEKDEFGI